MKDSPEPETTHTARLLQMRQLARPFRAELTSPANERTELRLVSRPLFEYSSPKQKVLDGSLFSFAVATDPEVLLLLLVEAFEEGLNGTKHAGYRYAFARFHYWNVAVSRETKKYGRHHSTSRTRPTPSATRKISARFTTAITRSRRPEIRRTNSLISIQRRCLAR